MICQVDLEQVAMDITRYAEEIGNLKQDIDDRAKDVSDTCFFLAHRPLIECCRGV